MNQADIEQFARALAERYVQLEKEWGMIKAAIEIMPENVAGAVLEQINIQRNK
ncbi:hypothetical protein D3C87_993960 [compost metagenome]